MDDYPEGSRTFINRRIWFKDVLPRKSCYLFIVDKIENVQMR